MREPNLFLEYLKEKHYFQLLNTVRGFLYANRTLVERKLNSGKRLLRMTIDDLSFQTVRFDDKGDDLIEFDVVISPEIECLVMYGKHHDVESDGVTDLWLSVTCQARLSDDFMHVNVLTIDDYSRKKQEKPLSGDLIPIIKKDEYDKYATEMLQRFYPEGLQQPCPIDIATMVARMGILLVDRPISKDGSIFGQIYFKDSVARLYDRKTNAIQSIQVPGNTIIVDTDSNSLFSFGCRKLTIAHECVHFYLHKKAFYFAQIFNKNLSHIQCQRDGGLFGENVGSRNNWMEIQANGIAPYILMPSKMVLKKVKFLEDVYVSAGQKPLEYAEKLVQDIANFFDVTVYAARKRLLDLGFTLAGGTLNWVDGHYVRPFLYKKGSLGNDETYTVSCKDIQSKLFSGGPVALLAMLGNFAFVENHLCIRSKKYIEKDTDGEDVLTEYAREHIDECCIKFKCTTTNEFLSNSRLETYCYLCRDFSRIFSIAIEVSQANDEILKSPEFLSNQKEYKEALNEMRNGIATLSFTDSLKYIVDNMDITRKALEIDSSLSDKTIQRYLKGSVAKPDKRTIIALGLAMNLPVEIIFELLKKAGIVLVQGQPEDDTLHYVVTVLRGKSVEAINKYLESVGEPPLSKAG